MDEYSSLGPGVVILPPADRVLKVSPKRGPGDQRGKRRKIQKRQQPHTAKQEAKDESGGPPEADNNDQGKGAEINIVI